MLKTPLPPLLWLVLAIWAWTGFAGAAPALALPFAPGEQLHFLLRWGPIEVGEARFEVFASDEFEPGGLRFHVTINSNAFADKFFKVRDVIDSYVDGAMSHSLHFRQKQREGSYHRDIEVDFDWNRLEAVYANEGKPRPPIALAPGAHDPLSAFYAFRVYDPAVREELALPVTDGKKLIQGSARRLGRETVETRAGLFDAWLVEPKLEGLGGIFRKSPRARLLVWVTADDRRVPVMVKSSVAVGNFTAELLSAENLKPGSVAAPDAAQTAAPPAAP